MNFGNSTGDTVSFGRVSDPPAADWCRMDAERGAITALRAVRDLTLRYNEQIRELHEANQKERDALHAKRDAAVTSAENTQRETVSGARERCKISVGQTCVQKNTLLGESGFGGQLKRVVMLITKGKADTDPGRMRYKLRETELDDLFESKISALNEYADAVAAEQTACANYEIAAAKEAFERDCAASRNRMQQAYNELLAGYKSELNALFGPEQVTPFVKTIRSSVPRPDGYVCASAVPDIVSLGAISATIAASNTLDPALCQALSEIAGGAASRSGMDMLVSLPYAQSINSGLSLFLSYASRDGAAYQKLLSLILLRLFMAFPAGKLEATMIDPLGMGSVFAMFAKLGEEQKRIIDTKAWSQEKDIEQAVAILRQKLETLAQSYGDHHEARRKQEPYRVLAITDFPTGFTAAALRDLQAIVRKGAELGVFVFIWANAKEVAKLEQSRMSIFNEIKQMLHAASAEGGVVTLETRVSSSLGSTDATTLKDISLQFDDMQDIEQSRHAIIETIAAGLHTAQRRIVYFEDMFEDIDDPNSWCGMDTIREFSVPIGMHGANSIVKLTLGASDGATAHHALIAGQTGAGKSTLLHTIIMSTLLNYSPDEVRLYLVDFKEGVELKQYTRHRLPSLRVVAIDSEREFGLNILRELNTELAARAQRFAAAGCEDISAYRAANKGKAPKLILLFDEVQILLTGDDDIAKESLKCLRSLVTQGRAMGIHVILACQDFRLAHGIDALYSQMAIRIAIKGDPDSSRSVLGNNNPGAMQLLDRDAGAAVFNDRNGNDQANVIFQVGYTTKEKRETYLTRLEALQNSDALRPLYAKYTTRILLTSAEDDCFNLFNTLILDGEAEPLFEDRTRYGLILGDSFDLRGGLQVGMEPRQRANLLLVGTEEKSAYSMFCFAMLSALHGELTNGGANKDDQLILLVDLSSPDAFLTEEQTAFAHIAKLFPRQIEHVRIREMEDVIRAVYHKLEARMTGDPSRERLFLMLFGVDRAIRLVNESMYEEEGETLNALKMLQAIVQNGAQHGVSCVFWGSSSASIARILGAGHERNFDLRTAFATDAETLSRLVEEHNPASLRESTAAFINLAEDYKNTHFRPFELPARWWVNEYARAYQAYIDKGV